MSHTALFQPITIASQTFNNRAWMAPLTRARAGYAHVPNALMAQYYAQRASAGLIVSECTMIAPDTSAFGAEPGIYTEEQINAWREVTDAVHAKGGKIFMQIWHAGRAVHSALNSSNAGVVSASAIALDGEVHTPNGKQAFEVPRALSADELPGIVAAFAQAAKNAVSAGFDGVEVHGANGYLLDQFLRDGANQRTDAYGGSMQNRARLLLEVLGAVTAAIGAERVGVRTSLLNSYNNMIDSDPVALATYLGQQFSELKLAYWHVMRGDFFQAQHGDILTPARANFNGVLVGNMGYSADEAEQAIAAGQLDVVAFGTGYLANPDFIERVQAGAALNAPNPETFYTPGAEGYTDYPTMTPA